VASFLLYSGNISICDVLLNSSEHIGYYQTQAFNRTKSIVITKKRIRANMKNVRHTNRQFNIYVHITSTESVYKKLN